MSHMFSEATRGGRRIGQEGNFAFIPAQCTGRQVEAGIHVDTGAQTLLISSFAGMFFDIHGRECAGSSSPESLWVVAHLPHMEKEIFW